MNEQIEVLMMGFRIVLDETAIAVLLDVLMDQVGDIAKQDPQKRTTIYRSIFKPILSFLPSEKDSQVLRLLH